MTEINGTNGTNIRHADKRCIRRAARPRAVREIAIMATPGEVRMLERFLRGKRLDYFIEPVTDPPYRTLKEVEMDCEGVEGAGLSDLQS